MRLFVDNLSNIDFSFLHPSRGLVGETWLASVELQGDLDDQGMVVDFGHVKRMLREWLDEEIDHRLLVPTHSTTLSLDNASNRVMLKWQLQRGQISHEGPSQSVALVDCTEITPESVARWCIERLKPQFPDSVKKLILRFEPEVIEGPFYHYSHGLKKHDGNCQRIAHGHRSPIKIWRNDRLCKESMQEWAERWQDIYIATSEDEVSSSDAQHAAFRYTAPQGDFYLELPVGQVYRIDTDSTIEFIAQHIATQLKAKSPQDSFRVKAFEGFAKGAIAEV